MSTPRIVVIGGGGAGLATALAAARLGARVTVLERDHPASGSSGRSAGIFNRQTPSRPEQDLRCFSVRVFDDLERVGLLHLHRTGYVRVARSDADLARYAAAQAHQQTLGVVTARVVDADELARLVPGMACGDLVGGLYCPDDGHLDGHELCGAYAKLAEALGVEVRHATAFRGIVTRPDRLIVATSDGEVACDRVVNAAGAWAEQVGCALGTCVALENQRHEICIAHLNPPLALPIPIVNTYVPGSGDYALYLRPEGRERILCGLHSHEAVAGNAVSDPDAYSRTVAHDTVERVAEQLLARMPGWRSAGLEPGWAGLYPISPDGLFQIGPYRDAPRVIAAAGLGGVGLTVSAAVGQLAAEWAVLGESHTFGFADALLPDRPTLRTRQGAPL